MSNVINLETKKNSKNGSVRDTFNRLSRRIEKLKQDVEKQQQQFDEALAFYHSHVEPERNRLARKLEECIKIIFHYYKSVKKLNTEDKELLKAALLHQIEQLFSLVPYAETDREIGEIFQNLQGFSYEEIVKDEFEEGRQMIQSMFAEKGIDVDLSDLDFNPNDAPEDIMRKVFQKMVDNPSLKESFQEYKEKKVESNPKSKRALQKEIEAQKLADLQKQGIGTIYKQLVKVFHPDLESCPDKKLHKAELMKKLTGAYENNDLYTLLSLQLEEFNQEVRYSEPPETTLKIYNTLLQDQIDELKQTLGTQILHARYFNIYQHVKDSPKHAKRILEEVYNSYAEDYESFRIVHEHLNSPRQHSTIRELIDAFSFFDLEDFYEN